MTPPSMPLHLGTPAQFEALRNLLAHAGYTEEAISSRLEIPRFVNFGSVQPGKQLTQTLGTPLDALLGADSVELMGSLGLLAQDSADPARLVPLVGLCPTRGVYLANDRGGE